MFYDPERTFEPSAENHEHEPLTIDYSGKMEWQAIVKSLALNPELALRPEMVSPEQWARIARQGNTIEAREMLLDQKDIFEIEEEITMLFEHDNFSIPSFVMHEMLPIHQYFALLREYGKATLQDERAYFEIRYGWVKHPDFFFDKWDDILTKLNALIRAKVCKSINEEEFNQYVQGL